MILTSLPTFPKQGLTNIKQVLKQTLSIILLLWATSSHAQDATNGNSSETNEQPMEEITENSTEKETENEAGTETKEIIPRISAKTILELQRVKLEQAYPQEQIIEISALDDRFLALWKEEQTGQPLGTVLIIHGEGQTADWPHTIGALRQDLPLRSWSTLAISLEDPLKKSIPKRHHTDQNTVQNTSPNAATEEEPDKEKTESEENDTTDEGNDDDQMSNSSNEENNSENALESTSNEMANTDDPMKQASEIEEQSIARIDAAVKHLQSQGQYNIVIAAHGFAAQRALQYIEKTGASKPKSTQANQNIVDNPDINIERNIRAMIFLNARNRLNKEHNSITNMFNFGNMPVLDIYFNLHFLDETDGAMRKREAKNKQLKNYFQKKLVAPSTIVFDQENRLTRRVRGFLKQHAQGVKLPN